MFLRNANQKALPRYTPSRRFSSLPCNELLQPATGCNICHMKVVRCNDETYALILKYAANHSCNITHAVDELVTGRQSKGVMNLQEADRGEVVATKRIDDLDLRTRSLLSFVHCHVLCDPNATGREFYCERCGEGLMEYVEEFNREGVCDLQTYRCPLCGWDFPMTNDR